MDTARGVLVVKRNPTRLTVFQKGDVWRSPETVHPALQFWLLPPLAKGSLQDAKVRFDFMEYKIGCLVFFN